MAITRSIFYTNMPVVAMKESFAKNAKVVSQTYYGEEVEIVERERDWCKIRTKDDQYVGWVQINTLIDFFGYYAYTDRFVKIDRGAAHIYEVKDTEYGPKCTLPYGCHLKVVDESDQRWLQVILLNGEKVYVQRGDVTFDHKQLTLLDLISFSKKFLDLPYTWGGRTSFGFDCSGFVQFLLRQIGILIPRDSKDQYTSDTFESIDLKDVRAGDVLFFGFDAEKIRHVVFCHDNQTFIHTSVRENKPYLRMSSVKDKEWSGSSEAYYPFRAAKRLITS